MGKPYIHRQYIEAGADIIYANTFSANRYKLSYSDYSVEELVRAGVVNAKKAAAASGRDVAVALDVGPIGELMEPNGSLKFEEAYDMFKEMMTVGEEAGADLVVIETSTDLLEMKAAVLAAKENTSLPVFSTMTFEKNGRTFTGVTVEAAALTLTGLGVDAIGINCSLGPNDIYPLAQKLVEWTPLPVIIKANAGLPNLNSGGYDISAEQFAEPIYSQLFHLVYDLAAAVITCAGIALGVFVGQYRAHSLHHLVAHEVLRSDQLDTLHLALFFLFDQIEKFGVFSHCR